MSTTKKQEVEEDTVDELEAISSKYMIDTDMLLSSDDGYSSPGQQQPETLEDYATTLEETLINNGSESDYIDQSQQHAEPLIIDQWIDAETLLIDADEQAELQPQRGKKRSHEC